MFTPLNQKKLVNVSVVALRRFGKRYELAVYPNKLYEYRNGMDTALRDILQSSTIYRNVSKGEIISQADLGLFGRLHDEIIREILDHGYEQKSEATRMHEQDMTEREILDLLRSKVRRDGKFLNEGTLREEIAKVHRMHSGGSKKQSQEILRKLEAAGFDRVGVRVSVAIDDRIRDFVEQHGEVCRDCVVIRADRFPEFRDLCDREGVRYSTMRMEEVEDEEIC